MKKSLLLGLSSLLTLSISAHAALSDSSQITSHKEYVPQGMKLTVRNIDKQAMPQAISLQKTRLMKRGSMESLFLADFVVDAKNKLGELTNLVAYVGVIIPNISEFIKTYAIRTEICSEFIFSDSCATTTDYIQIQPNSEFTLSKEMELQVEYPDAGKYEPSAFTTITELDSDSTVTLIPVETFNIGKARIIAK